MPEEGMDSYNFGLELIVLKVLLNISLAEERQILWYVSEFSFEWEWKESKITTIEAKVHIIALYFIFLNILQL